MKVTSVLLLDYFPVIGGCILKFKPQQRYTH